jgi:hypothetical protein
MGKMQKNTVINCNWKSPSKTHEAQTILVNLEVGEYFPAAAGLIP